MTPRNAVYEIRRDSIDEHWSVYCDGRWIGAAKTYSGAVLVAMVASR